MSSPMLGGSTTENLCVAHCVSRCIEHAIAFRSKQQRCFSSAFLLSSLELSDTKVYEPSTALPHSLIHVLFSSRTFPSTSARATYRAPFQVLIGVIRCRASMARHTRYHTYAKECGFRCRASMAHIRQSRPDHGLGFHAKGL